MFYQSNYLCKELTKRGIEYEYTRESGEGGEVATTRFRNVIFMECDDGYSYFKIIDPLMFQIIDYIDLDAPDYPR